MIVCPSIWRCFLLSQQKMQIQHNIDHLSYSKLSKVLTSKSVQRFFWGRLCFSQSIVKIHELSHLHSHYNTETYENYYLSCRKRSESLYTSKFYCRKQNFCILGYQGYHKDEPNIEDLYSRKVGAS